MTAKRNKQIRVLLVGKYPIVQESLRHLLEAENSLMVSGLVSFDDDIRGLASITVSDVAVVYLTSDDRVEVVSDLLQRSPSLRILILVAGADLDAQAEALRMGAVGIVKIDQNPKMLIEAIRQTNAGETWLNQALLHRILTKDRTITNGPAKSVPGSDTESLTTRELDVMKLLAVGLKNKEIARELLVSEATIRHHLTSIYGKFGVEDRLNLVILAYRNGLVEFPNVSKNGNP